jgi:hypothetical protein
MVTIEEKAIEFVKKYETLRTGKEPQDVRGKRLGYDLESRDRKIEAKATKANIPNKAGLHITLLPHQHDALQKNSDYWIYRVYNAEREGKERVIAVPRKVILKHLKPYTVHKLVLKKEDWKQLSKEGI